MGIELINVKQGFLNPKVDWVTMRNGESGEIGNQGLVKRERKRISQVTKESEELNDDWELKVPVSQDAK